MKLSDKVVLITYRIDLLRPEGPKKIYFKTPPSPSPFRNNTKENVLEPEKMNVKFHKHYILHKKFSEFYLCFHSSCEI